MAELAPIDALIRGAALAIPVAMLALLFFLLVRRKQEKREARTADREAEAPSPLVSTVAARIGEIAPRIVREVHEVARHIESARASGDNGALAALYLELAHSHARQGEEAAHMAALRSAAASSSQHGPRSIHAAARVELAEAAYRAGDLTSACEQWQLARVAYYEDGQLELHASIEKRMRANGCPTDWVLTDF